MQGSRAGYFLIQCPPGFHNFKEWPGLSDLEKLPGYTHARSPACTLQQWRGRTPARRIRQDITFLTNSPDIAERLIAGKASNGKQAVQTALAEHLPKRLAVAIAEEANLTRPLGDLSDKVLRQLGERVNRWRVKPSGSEGYRTAEVTLGGIDTAALNQKTMEVKAAPGLYFIGEAVDVTGWLGGYNFQWAWSSGWSAGQAV